MVNKADKDDFGGFVKIWTNCYQDDWFNSLSCTQRGFWFQLILLAKVYGDTGHLCFRSYSALAQQCGMDDSSSARILRFFAEHEKVVVQKGQSHTLLITIPNYEHYQRVKEVSERGQNRRKIAGKSPLRREEKRREENYVAPAPERKKQPGPDEVGEDGLTPRQRWEKIKEMAAKTVQEKSI